MTWLHKAEISYAEVIQVIELNNKEETNGSYIIWFYVLKATLQRS